MLPLLALLVDFAGTVVILVAAVRCLWDYLRSRPNLEGLGNLQMRLAQGLVLALSFESGAGVIRTATAVDWSHLKTLAATIALRFFLGYTLKAQISRRWAAH